MRGGNADDRRWNTGWDASPVTGSSAQHNGRCRTAIQACWTPPADAGNSTVTLSFSFKRDGSLIGPPRPTAAKVAGDDKARKAFIEAAIAAVKSCTPLTFSPALAKGIGGNVFTLQLVSPKQ